VSDPHDLRSPYPFRRRVACPLDPHSIEDALTCMSRHFRLGMWDGDVMAYARVVRLCPLGTLSNAMSTRQTGAWCIRWCHGPGPSQTSIVIEHPDYPYGVCGDEIETF
jgi:hypothetical protein